MADLDADGHPDVLSGSYSPGQLFWWRGLGKGRFAKGAALKGEDGEDLTAAPPGEAGFNEQMAGFAAAPFFFDWDGDGDLDVLVGNVLGYVVLIENTGTAREPRWSARRTEVEAGGKVIAVRKGDAGVCVADWDGDGRPDLLVGAGDGSVQWFKNTAERGEPVLAAGQVLVEKLPNGGQRAKLCVGDWDGDGVRDLLVGDFDPGSESALVMMARKMRLSKLQNREKELVAARADIEKSDALSAADRAAKLGQNDRELAELRAELAALWERIGPHGYVWLFRGRGAKS